MYKNIIAYGFILTALLTISGTLFAADVSKNQPVIEQAPIELQRGQLQSLTLI
ncbi:hypothetical protein C8R34_10479 [Nitrosomonas sp. Nm84]|nr:hypothetical protein C8R34_10479 [Nitrosomonas sp. Nm84]